MKRALLLHGQKQTPVLVEETNDGGLIVQLNGKDLFRLQPVAEVQSFPNVTVPLNRQPQVSDLNGDPAHDWPLFVRKFQETQSALVMDMATFYKKQFGYSTPGIENMLRAGDDLVELQPVLSEIITTEGKLKYGARSAIAKQLGIKDAGGYRGRIDAVVSVLQGNYSALLEENGDLLEVSGAKVEDFNQKAVSPNTSTTFQERRKSANK